MDRKELVEFTTEIVSSYVGNNAVATSEIPSLINSVYASLTGVSATPDQKQENLSPAVPIKKSVQADTITCLECGKKQKTMKRHLTSAHGMTPEEYRAKWSLPADYPMTAPNYASLRSNMAKQIGLGRKRGETREAVSA